MSTAPHSVPPELEGLQLGPLLGKGSYGRVYRGWFHEEAVAVKVKCTRAYRRLQRWLYSSAAGMTAEHTPQLVLSSL